MPGGSPALRVAIAENSRLFRDGLVLQLEAAGVGVVAECDRADDLIDLLPELRPDLVLMDIRMPPTETDEGIRAAAEIRDRFPGVGILILSTYAESTYAAAVLAISETAIGYLLKDRVTDVGALLDALQRIAAGECVVDPDVVATLLGQPPRRDDLAQLTARERTVLHLMAEGRSNASIAEQLSLTVRTVEAYTAAIFAKLGLVAQPQTNRRVAAVIAWLRGSHTVY
ncbi:response regulator transcription factor [Nocardioides mangrovicus]|uniref:response regulator transcription factor n=1 Tax=Nocardioides mangrovicus TaxID=2478913 RepID=UPI001E4402CD|nr:response regulator transcription factor [Nocardioides mangrovicus]